VTADDVLIWVAARGEGSWSQFRRAVDSIYSLNPEGDEHEYEEDFEIRSEHGIPQQILLRENFLRLGHCEFFTHESRYRWRVVPPVLASNEANGIATGILCGARTPKLIEAIAANCSKDEMRTHGLKDAPEAILIEADSWRRISEIAEKSRVLFQRQASQTILLAHPDIQSRAWETSARLPAGDGWPVKSFNSSALAWVQSSPQEARGAMSGLFRVQAFYPWRCFMKTGGRVIEVPREISVYRRLKIARRSVLRYDEQAKTLSMPAACRPPMLIERALVLLSGKLPDVSMRSDKKLLASYSNVPISCAKQISAILGQRLK
jgi:hypothetical protein